MAVLNYSTDFQRTKYCDNTAELHFGKMSNLVLTELVVVIRKMTERHHTCNSGGNLHFRLFAISMNMPINYSAV